MRILRKSARAGAVVATVAIATAVFTAAPASAAKSCHISISTGKFTCGNADSIRKSSDVIGAKVFTNPDFNGDSLTIWMPRPCKKDGKYEGMISLGTDFANKISSVQGWANCWVWLHFRDGNREGPYQDNAPDVGSSANDRAVEVGIS